MQKKKINNNNNNNNNKIDVTAFAKSTLHFSKVTEKFTCRLSIPSYFRFQDT